MHGGTPRQGHVHLAAALAHEDGRPAVLARYDFSVVGEASRAQRPRSRPPLVELLQSPEPG